MAAASTTEALRDALADAYAGRQGKASLTARLVLKVEPRNPEAHYVLGIAALVANQPQDGLTSFQEATRLAPREHRYIFALGIALDRVGKRDESISAYQRALAEKPGHFETAANLGSVLERAGRPAAAREAYAVALRAKPAEALVLHGIGLCHLALGDLPAAEAALRGAVNAQPSFAQAHNHLGTVLGRQGRRDEAIASIREALRLRADYLQAWFSLAEHYLEAGFDQAALEALDRTLALAPGHPGAHYLRSALTGVTIERPPSEYIKSAFDRFAPDFDARLTEKLEYRIPEKMALFLKPLCKGPSQRVRLLDLGCGTGLSGRALRSMAGELVGVDLSPGMLERARATGVYDALHECDITTFLRREEPGRWNVLVALDVFIYIGALGDAFEEAARVLPSGGLLAFSVERLDNEDGYALQRSGRYAHSRSYLDACASDAGLDCCALAEETIRLEHGEPVLGLVAAYRKP